MVQRRHKSFRVGFENEPAGFESARDVRTGTGRDEYIVREVGSDEED